MTDLEKMADAQTMAVSEVGIAKQEGLGVAIVRAATDAYREEWQKAVVDGVKRMMSLRDEARERIDFFTKAVGWYTKKIEALGAGKFELTKRGELVFEDPNLNRGNY